VKKGWMAVWAGLVVWFSVPQDVGASSLPDVWSMTVHTGTNTLELYSFGVLIRRFPVATGTVTEPTPHGIFPVVMKVKNPWYIRMDIPGGDPRNPLGTRWIGLLVPGTDGSKIGIHGTNRNDQIGSRVSSGCIRMRNADVEWLYDRVPTGTAVLVD
jgi:lipoprotein-anchoring transpeptidase ErfK/SrfK